MSTYARYYECERCDVGWKSSYDTTCWICGGDAEARSEQYLVSASVFRHE